MRVLSPGNSGSVTQVNSSSATASATDTAAGAGTESADAADDEANSQTAEADATAQQASSTNQNVSVRIEEPGTSGTVSQTNSSSASAGASNTVGTAAGGTPPHGGNPPSLGTGQAGGAQNAGASATSTQTNPSNVNFAVRVFSPGDNGAVTQTNNSTAGAASSISGSSATAGASPTADGQASQVNPSNANFTVRILSPGTNGAVTQTNTCSSSEQTTVGSVSTLTNEDCTDPSATSTSSAAQVVGGAAQPITAPEGQNDAVWTWTWNWTVNVDEAGNVVYTVDPSSIPGWNWTWDGTTVVMEPTAEGAAGPEAGNWNWVWNWTVESSTPRDADSNWTWSPDLGPNWTWTWNWTWATPAGNSPDNGQANDQPPIALSSGDQSVEQSNETVAIAEAQNNYTYGQTIYATEIAPSILSGFQSTENFQWARANASATQSGTWNVGDWNGGSDQTSTVTRINRVTAEAIAANTYDVTQTIGQKNASPEAPTQQSQGATQISVNVQDASASARASQSSDSDTYGASDAAAGYFSSGSSAVAIAVNVNEVVQTIGQLGGEFEQTVTQISRSSQTASAEASAELTAPGIAIAGAIAVNTNAITQDAAGDVEGGIAQTVTNSQSATAYAGVGRDAGTAGAVNVNEPSQEYGAEGSGVGEQSATNDQTASASVTSATDSAASEAPSSDAPAATLEEVVLGWLGTPRGAPLAQLIGSLDGKPLTSLAELLGATSGAAGPSQGSSEGEQAGAPATTKNPKSELEELTSIDVIAKDLIALAVLTALASAAGVPAGGASRPGPEVAYGASVVELDTSAAFAVNVNRSQQIFEQAPYTGGHPRGPPQVTSQITSNTQTADAVALASGSRDRHNRNSSEALAAAVNKQSITQVVSQEAGAEARQEFASTQLATALANAIQLQPGNLGEGRGLRQENAVVALALGLNESSFAQTISTPTDLETPVQAQVGSVQQEADATALARQEKALNLGVGSGEQLNLTEAVAVALNKQALAQVLPQSDSGDPEPAPTPEGPQELSSTQLATALAEAVQIAPANIGAGSGLLQQNVSGAVAIAASGSRPSTVADEALAGSLFGELLPDPNAVQLDTTAIASASTLQDAPTNLGLAAGGVLEQTNAALAAAIALNFSSIDPTARGAVQAPENSQIAPQATASAQTSQSGALNAGITLGSGVLTQANTATSAAIAANVQWLSPVLEQTQTCIDCGFQGQSAFQPAGQGQFGAQTSASALTNQVDPGNFGVVLGSGGLDQTNLAGSAATAANAQVLSPTLVQTEFCVACGSQIESAFQPSGQGQFQPQATASAQTTQLGATNAGALVGSGVLNQANAATSAAAATNVEILTPKLVQTAWGLNSGFAGQFPGQPSGQGQFQPQANATAATTQLQPSNLGSIVGSGVLDQTNVAASNATAANVMTLAPTLVQTLTCKFCGGPTQSGFQPSGQGQFQPQANASASTTQLQPSNLGGIVGSGVLDQTNTALSAAVAANAMTLVPTVIQTLGCESCGGQSQSFFQSTGQGQFQPQANATAATTQLQPGNLGGIVGSGGLIQTNAGVSSAAATNEQTLAATIVQTMTCSFCGGQSQSVFQAAGQGQFQPSATALAQTTQLQPTNLGAIVGSAAVIQANAALSAATAANVQTLVPSVFQTIVCSFCGGQSQDVFESSGQGQFQPRATASAQFTGTAGQAIDVVANVMVLTPSVPQTIVCSECDGQSQSDVVSCNQTQFPFQAPVTDCGEPAPGPEPGPCSDCGEQTQGPLPTTAGQPGIVVPPGPSAPPPATKSPPPPGKKTSAPGKRSRGPLTPPRKPGTQQNDGHSTTESSGGGGSLGVTTTGQAVAAGPATVGTPKQGAPATGGKPTLGEALGGLVDRFRGADVVPEIEAFSSAGFALFILFAMLMFFASIVVFGWRRRNTAQ